MQKICVVTWYNTDNYGTQLQSAALCKYLEKCGMDVYVLKAFKYLPHILKHPQLLLTRIAVRLNEKNRKKFFHPVQYEISSERKAHIAEYVKDNFNPLVIRTADDWKKIVDDKMIFISGSDIIWQPAMGRPGRMFLDFAAYDGLTRVSYASSTGAKKLPEKYYSQYKRVLKGFKAISTREQNSADFFTELLGRPVTKVIDPTLLHDRDFWDTFAAKARIESAPKGKYILCYFVMNDPRYWEYMKMVREQYPDHNIIVLPMHHEDETKGYFAFNTGTAYEFIRLISEAAFIVTDSFHAGVFSFIYDKEFYILKRARSDEDEKFNDLVDRYGLRNRIITDESKFERLEEHDYSEGKQQLQQDREFAYEFLKNALGL